MHEVQYGTNTRESFSKIKEVLEMPDLIEIQKNSYQRFLDEGLGEVLRDISPITDYSENLVLEFTGYEIGDEPKYPVEECKERDVNYAAPLKVKARLQNKEQGDMVEQEVFMGDFPLMTDKGTFIINGAERVIVSQLVRSPGVYYGAEKDKAGKDLFTSTVIPNRGAWLECETDSNDVMYIRVDRTRKLPVTIFLRAMGLGTDQDIIDYFGEDANLEATFKKDTYKTKEDGLLYVYGKLRPGEPQTVESANTLLNSLFFDAKRYDLAKVGRYKFNEKLALAPRVRDQVLATPVIVPETGEVILNEGDVLNKTRLKKLEQHGINAVDILVGDETVRVSGNGFVDASLFLKFDPAEVGITERVYYPELRDIIEECGDDKALLKTRLKENLAKLIPMHVVKEDIYASISYFLGLKHGIGHIDDIDHLGNRRLRSVGELLQNQIRVGLTRLERVVRERMSIQDLKGSDDKKGPVPSTLINIRPVTAAIKEFFGSSQLSQFMDQTNPLAELTHKRRLSALGPGGLNRERASFDVRDVHPSHYGRMCPIETPEGPNIGLIGSLSTYAKINDYGFIETPFRLIDKKQGVVLQKVAYMTAHEEDDLVVAQANEPIDENGRFVHDRVMCRVRDQIVEVPREEVDLMDVSPRQLVSVAASLIPFLENDDANRALMGCNMQRQAVPLLVPESPIVGTGMEYKSAYDSGVLVISGQSGIVKEVSADKVVITPDPTPGQKKPQDVVYNLIKFARSNQGTCINQLPIVRQGQRIEKGDVIADGPSTQDGEMALGKNLLIGFMTWEGYNYEDAMLISERLVKDDTLTSIHIEEYESEARDTKLGPEEITRDIPNVGDDALRDLDAEGIIRVGAEVHSGDILVGKVTPKGETELTAEERLLRAIFAEKAREVRDTSLRVPHGEGGIVVDVKIFTQEKKDELTAGVKKLVRVYIAQKRKISVGDKMAGRHGNKGVISRILPVEDMPFLPDGTPLDIVLNPLGVPSRMNIGQVLEVHLGMAAKAAGYKIATPVFDGATEEDIEELLRQNGLEEDGKTVLYDGRSGEPFENRVTVGYMYILKLHHLVDDKVHARSTGPYSLVTQQPLGGKAQFGGQRFGEMEVWALEAYGAANTLQEILTVKSDDVVGRVKTYEAIVKGENIPEPGVPESFKVLIKEMQSLGLDIKVLSEDKGEIKIRESDEDDALSLDINIAGVENSDELEQPEYEPGGIVDGIDDMSLDELELPDINLGEDDDEMLSFETLTDDDILGDAHLMDDLPADQMLDSTIDLGDDVSLDSGPDPEGN
ncbi:MAG: DNA-directed RNA polymerase subunit beta [Clostridia bacterium]|nr:DNA-directed RNA polymerase subunit beta [Clostridia bacterium]